MRRRTRMRISGLVQGVFFRASARDKAHQLGLAGFARNEPDGTVLIEVEGDFVALAAFVAWCNHGPPDARVTAVESVEVSVQGDTNFVVSR